MIRAECVACRSTRSSEHKRNETRADWRVAGPTSRIATLGLKIVEPTPTRDATFRGAFMGILIYLTPAVVLWAITATVLAWVFFGRLRREQQQQANVQDSLARHQAALSQMKARAVVSARELEALQQAYASL